MDFPIKNETLSLFSFLPCSRFWTRWRCCLPSQTCCTWPIWVLGPTWSASSSRSDATHCHTHILCPLYTLLMLIPDSEWRLHQGGHCQAGQQAQRTQGLYRGQEAPRAHWYGQADRPEVSEEHLAYLSCYWHATNQCRLSVNQIFENPNRPEYKIETNSKIQ